MGAESHLPSTHHVVCESGFVQSKVLLFPRNQFHPTKLSSCVSASLSMSAKPVSRWAMPAGSSTALSMASSLTAKCHQTRQLVVEMTPSTPSSVRLVLASTSPGLCLLIWSHLL